MERKISKSGGITIPSSMRRDLGIQGKEKVALITKDNGDILIKRIQGSCVFCESIENVEPFKGKFVCSNCKEELKG